MTQFRQKAEQEGCNVKNVIELFEQWGMMYVLDVPDGKEDLISQYGFYSWIDNPEFQKYYEYTPEVIDRIKEDKAHHEWKQKQKRT